MNTSGSLLLLQKHFLVIWFSLSKDVNANKSTYHNTSLNKNVVEIL